jgi:hypothetical protein
MEHTCSVTCVTGWPISGNMYCKYGYYSHSYYIGQNGLVVCSIFFFNRCADPYVLIIIIRYSKSLTIWRSTFLMSYNAN